jgi:outer membrane biosynthesis protein TonB
MHREEAVGLYASLTGHVTLIALLTYGVLFLPKAAAPAPEAMEVAFVDEAGLTSAAPVPATEAPMIGAASEAGPIEDAASAPAPVSAPVPPQAPVARENAAPPQRQQVRQPARPSPQPGSGERTRRALLDDRNFLKGIGTDRVSQSNRPPAQMTGAQRSSFRSLIAQALRRCEDHRFPAPEARAIKVQVRVTLNRDGSRASAEVVRVRNPDPNLARYEQRMRDLAMAVVRGCTPIRGLPEEFYDVPGGWRQFDYEFPRNS